MVKDRTSTPVQPIGKRKPKAFRPGGKIRRIVTPAVIATVALLLTGLPSARAVMGNAQRLTTIVVISIDALHPDALKRSNVPTLSRLMQTGAYTLDGRSTIPPKTLIAHTAMFTGLSPKENGKVDNEWTPGETTVIGETLFDSARRHGFKTGYFYSKEKLGYLVNRALDAHAWSRENAVDSAEGFLKTAGRHFVFLHVSGLDDVGPQHGWLSPEYLEELSLIDDYLSSLVQWVVGNQKYLVIVTSDHAGHDKVHGGNHPEDGRLPMIVCSDTVAVNRFQGTPYAVVDLKKMIEDLLQEEP